MIWCVPWSESQLHHATWTADLPQGGAGLFPLAREQAPTGPVLRSGPHALEVGCETGADQDPVPYVRERAMQGNASEGSTGLSEPALQFPPLQIQPLLSLRTREAMASSQRG